MRILKSQLKHMINTILNDCGVQLVDRELLFDLFLDAEIRGKYSHGFMRFLGTAKQLKKFDGNIPLPSVFRISDSSIQIKANDAVGVLATKFACDEILKIQQQPITTAAVSGFSSTTGALGYYARYMAKNGKITLIFANAKSAVAPYGGIKPVIGTNPLAIGIPNGDKPIIVDMSTAAITYGDILIAQKERQQLPDNVVINSYGNVTNNPFDVDNGCQLPLAGHKGYALGLVIEILAGIFIGAKSGNNVPGSEGVLIISIDKDLYVPETQFDKNLTAFISELINIEAAEDFNSVRIPGDNIRNSVDSDFIEIKEYVFYEIETMFRKVTKIF
jgi:LDH2 family malate/lactate/ureidoglycolate dehydrogenase